MTATEGSPDTIVIGGGLVGAAIAWGLARAGERVLVLDEGDVALRASRGNFGLVWVQCKGSNLSEYARWSRHSADVWPEFADVLTEQTGISPDYHKPGGLQLFLTEAERDEMVELNSQMSAIGGIDDYGAEILDRQQVKELMPAIGPKVIGASYGKHDGHVSPLRLLRSLHAGLAALGARYCGDGRVETVARDGDGFVVRTAKATFHCARVVLAAGHGNPRLAPMLGMNIPLRPDTGQILVTERCAPFLNMPTDVVRQSDEGSVLLGDSHEDTGYSTRSTVRPITDIARHALDCFPALARLRIVRTWAAVRIMSPDGGPIYEQSPEAPGAFSISCHSGVTLAGAHAMSLAPMIARGSLSPEHEIFSTRRFHGTAH